MRQESKGSILLVVALFLIGFLAASHSQPVKAVRERIACSEYTEPQLVYDSNPVKYKKLDGDDDGLACE